MDTRTRRNPSVFTDRSKGSRFRSLVASEHFTKDGQIDAYDPVRRGRRGGRARIRCLRRNVVNSREHHTRQPGANPGRKRPGHDVSDHPSAHHRGADHRGADHRGADHRGADDGGAYDRRAQDGAAADNGPGSHDAAAHVAAAYTAAASAADTASADDQPDSPR
jgi:hypothetical protein